MRRFFKDNWWFIVTVASILFWFFMILLLLGDFLEANGAQGMTGALLFYGKFRI